MKKIILIVLIVTCYSCVKDPVIKGIVAGKYYVTKHTFNYLLGKGEYNHAYSNQTFTIKELYDSAIVIDNITLYRETAPDTIVYYNYWYANSSYLAEFFPVNDSIYVSFYEGGLGAGTTTIYYGRKTGK
ncbi:MAG: hypothetical protein H0W62_14245 [Chitinophagales bacterium]|nr:hypothetical protein [Chitinophagales bacterium]